MLPRMYITWPACWEKCLSRSSDMEPCAHTESFSRLTEVYRCVETASKPGGSPADVARWMFPLVCGSRGADLTHIAVTVLGRIASCVTAQSSSLLPVVASYFTELLKVLFDDMKLMSHLVSHFEDEDQILSHLAAKSASAYVLHLLHQSGAVCPVWKQKCLQAFDCSALGRELDACLWSLTEVLKRLLKGAHRELFGKFLRGFDSSLSALCLKYFPGDETAHHTDHPDSRQLGTTLCLLTDLMEVLTASSVTPGGCFCLQSQKLTYVHSSALLKAISHSTESFVRRRALLLLKRAVLQRAGEDWSLGGALAAEPTHEHLSADMRTLSHSVLTAVAAGWLESVQVDGASFFGGTKPEGDKFRRPDCVTLRAVSLLFLKSMDLHIQSACGSGLDNTLDIQGDFQRLWCFLQSNSAQLKEASHLCCWLSLLFGEQDDDMMEAAKALLSLFLHHRRRHGCDGVAALDAACGLGCNPHCHFIVLLQSVSFDHSILLDFLISTETCFLEYFVRYLRFLRSDPQGFAAACRVIDSLDCRLPKRLDDAEPEDTKRSADRFRLVDYPSSDESDQDVTDCQGEPPGTSVCDEMRSSSGNVKQQIRGSHSESSYLPQMRTKTKTTSERRPGRLSLAVSAGEQTSCPVTFTPMSKCTGSKTSERAADCLSQLREVVTRLQAKKLFPYNPSSLLKLLTQVEKCSRSPPSTSINE